MDQEQTPRLDLRCCDSLGPQGLPSLPDNSLDAIVTDPPSGTGFMGQEWDDHSGYEPQSEKGRAVLAAGKAIGLEPWEAGFAAFTADWASEALRALKPGAHALVWALPRTSDLTAIGLRAVGFELREKISHIFGSGFPKSLDISKAIDLDAFTTWLAHNRPRAKRWAKRLWKATQKDHWAWRWCQIVLGVWETLPGKRQVIGERQQRNPYKGSDGLQFKDAPDYKGQPDPVTAPATPEAQKWDGFGTALKPSHECWILCRKPLSEDTLIANVLKHGTGGLNVDGGRVGAGGQMKWSAPRNMGYHSGNESGGIATDATSGRWPPNAIFSHHPECRPTGTGQAPGPRGGAGVLFSHQRDGTIPQKPAVGATIETMQQWDCVPGCPVRLLGEQSGESASRTGKPRRSANPGDGYGMTRTGAEYDDCGSAARYFPQFQPDEEDLLTEALFLYCIKPSRREKEEGCEHLPARQMDESREDGNPGGDNPRNRGVHKRKNHHPTVKGKGLMRWLCRLITPPGGLPCDPFMGSGTTGIVCVEEGFGFIGFERREDYFAVAEARIALARRVEREKAAAAAAEAANPKPRQLTLFDAAGG